MKKFLIGTTALVAAGFVAGQAQAADPVKLSIGGYIEEWVGYADNENENSVATEYAEVLNQSDSEIYFRGSTKLDNGLTVGVTIDMETDRDDDSEAGKNQDDVFVSISSDALGTVKLGATRGVAYGFGHTSKDVGIGLNDGDVENWIAKDASASSINNTLTSGQDGQTVAYVSPSFGGVQVAGSFGTNASTVPTGALNVKSNGIDTRWDFAIAYNGEIEGVAIGADYGWQKINAGGVGGVPHGYDTVNKRAGLSVGVAGFTIAGSYLDVENFSGTKDRDADAWDLGVAYAAGPMSVSLSYMESNVQESGTDNREDTAEKWMLSGSYDLGAGVAVKGSIFAAEYDDASTTGSNVAGDDDGFGVVAGIRVDF